MFTNFGNGRYGLAMSLNGGGQVSVLYDLPKPAYTAEGEARVYKHPYTRARSWSWKGQVNVVYDVTNPV